jgi:hypothetical protein
MAGKLVDDFCAYVNSPTKNLIVSKLCCERAPVPAPSILPRILGNWATFDPLLGKYQLLFSQPTLQNIYPALWYVGSGRDLRKSAPVTGANLAGRVASAQVGMQASTA